MPKHDPVSYPAHYNPIGRLECIEVIKNTLSPEEFNGYLRGNCIKYLYRSNQKGGVEDLSKAKWYLERLICQNEEK